MGEGSIDRLGCSMRQLGSQTQPMFYTQYARTSNLFKEGFAILGFVALRGDERAISASVNSLYRLAVELKTMCGIMGK
jgi:hypothetical protein